MPITEHSNSRQSVRPSIHDLQNDDFLEQLSIESNKISQTNSFTYTDPLAPKAARSSAHESTGKPRKSRFALAREAELEASRLQAEAEQALKVPQVPLGRFQLNLSDDEDDRVNVHTSATQSSQLNEVKENHKSRGALLGEIFERDEMMTEAPNNDFESNFQPSGFPSVISSQEFPARYQDRAERAPEYPWEQQRTPKLSSTHSRSSTEKSTDSEFSFEAKNRISAENEATLAHMSESEILAAQAEVKAMLISSNPELLEKLLHKPNLPPDNPPRTEENVDPKSSDSAPLKKHSKPVKRVQFSDVDSSASPSASCLNPEKSCYPDLPSGDDVDAIKAGTDSCCHAAVHQLAQTRQCEFGINGRMVGDPATTATDLPPTHSTVDSLHPQRVETFTLQQLFGLIMSSVPSQRVFGYKIMARITDRYLSVPQEAQDTDDVQMFRKTELQPAISEMVMAASHALCHNSIGIVDSALTLLYSIVCGLIRAKESIGCSSLTSRLEWIEDLFTETDILGKIHSHIRFQVLPKSSLVIMVRFLSAIIQLSESVRVSEEITKRPMFLEELVQVLISAEWPPTAKTKIELPDLDCLQLLRTLAQSSRQCCHSQVERGLLTPTFRYIALPFWSVDIFAETSDLTTMSTMNATLSMSNFMSQQFCLLSTYAAYGLGTSLRTTLDPLLRSITPQLQKRISDILDRHRCSTSDIGDQLIHHADILLAYMTMLTRWMQCANDPHVLDPPHSIDWSQVIDWSSDGVDVMSLCLRENSASIDLPPARCFDVTNDVLASACDMLEVYTSGCMKKNIDTSAVLDKLSQMAPQLQARLRRATLRFCSTLYSSPRQLNAQCLRDAHLIISMARLGLSIQNTCAAQLPECCPTWHVDVSSCPTNDQLALAYQLAFKHDELSAVPTSLCSLYMSAETRVENWVCANSLLLRNSDGDIVSSLITTVVNSYQATLHTQVIEGLNRQSSTGIAIGLQASDVDFLRPLYETYANESAAFTNVKYPNPSHIQNLMKQCDPPAFVLSSTWPLLSLNFLTKPYLKSLSSGTPDTGISIQPGVLTRLIRTSLGLARFVQADLYRMRVECPTLSTIFAQVVADGISIWKAILTTVIVCSSQASWDMDGRITDGRTAGSIFEDEPTCKLICEIISPFQLRSRRKARDAITTIRHSPKSQSDEMELYSMFTDILGIYDSTSFANPTFSLLLVPFFNMRLSADFRRLAFKDYAHLLLHLQVGTEDVLIWDSNAADLSSYLYPLESDEGLLVIYCQMLGRKSAIKEVQHPFLYTYLLHHVASTLWALRLSAARLQAQLARLLLSQCADEVCRDIIRYRTLSGPAGHELMEKPSREAWLAELLAEDAKLLERSREIFGPQ